MRLIGSVYCYEMNYSLHTTIGTVMCDRVGRTRVSESVSESEGVSEVRTLLVSESVSESEVLTLSVSESVSESEFLTFSLSETVSESEVEENSLSESVSELMSEPVSELMSESLSELLSASESIYDLNGTVFLLEPSPRSNMHLKLRPPRTADGWSVRLMDGLERRTIMVQ